MSRAQEAADAGIACQIDDLSVAYGASLVLRHVRLQVPAGVVMGLVGPNGAGKSTLVKASLGLVAPLAGRVTFFGRPWAQARHRVAYMPQTADVDWDFPITVREVVAMGTYGRLGWFRRPGRPERARISSALREVGLGELADRPIGQLSGGQRQRAFLARTLAQEPDLFVMDEPFAGVDARSQHAIVTVLHRLRSQGRTVLMVHHDLATVRRYCDHVTLLNREVVASGPVAQAFTPQTVRRAYGVTDSDDPFLALL